MCAFELVGRGDLLIYLSAAFDLNDHINIYEKGYIDGFSYYYSVLFALLLNPLGDLPYYLIKYCWIFFNSLLFFHLLRLLFNSTLLHALSPRKKNLFILLTFLASLRFFHNNIHTSQITILILWCCTYGLYLVAKKREVTGALLIALGINIKLLPVVLIPYLIYRGRFKVVFWCAGFYVVMLFLPSVLIGHNYNMTLLASWAKLINPMNQRHILDVDERSFHGLSTLFSTLLVKDVPDLHAMALRRNLLDVSLETLATVILVARLALVALTLYFLKLRPFKNPSSELHRCLEVSYILLLIPLIFPHQQHYAFLFATPAFAVLLYGVFTEPPVLRHPGRMKTFLWVICIVFNLSLLLGQFNPYYDHYKIITYAALMLIPALMVFRERVLSE
jgi:hypothetical protein